MGQVSYGVSEADSLARKNRRSIYVVNDIKAGELITTENIKEKAWAWFITKVL